MDVEKIFEDAIKDCKYSTAPSGDYIDGIPVISLGRVIEILKTIEGKLKDI